MLQAFAASDGLLRPVGTEQEAARSFAGVAWIDLCDPTDEEEGAVEAELGIDVPTQEEMEEIEPTSRLYQVGDALFMTGSALYAPDGEAPQTSPVTFVLTRGRLVSVRYTKLRAFDAFTDNAMRKPTILPGGEGVMIGLLEAMVDRLADILEIAGGDIDALSQHVIAQNREARAGRRDLGDALARVGRNGYLASKARESLISLGRVIAFVGQDSRITDLHGMPQRLKLLRRDVDSLTAHSAFLADRVTFVLDATLGLISIEQNAIIKIFSVMAVIFLPPTLVASIYGMNFEHMPELDWWFGYPLAILVMILVAIGPYLFFKSRGWL
jgi:magnesium transporter